MGDDPPLDQRLLNILLRIIMGDHNSWQNHKIARKERFMNETHEIFDDDYSDHFGMSNRNRQEIPTQIEIQEYCKTTSKGIV